MAVLSAARSSGSAMVSLRETVPSGRAAGGLIVRTRPAAMVVVFGESFSLSFRLPGVASLNA
ncbi:hypothetical protein D3C83_289620 [compost metagenome]